MICSGKQQSVFSSSSMVASASRQPLEYEVFLSFRGPDVRKSFADCLYSCLIRSKICTFRDEEELHKGEKIGPSLIQAISESKVYIPVLTKSYASSKWCLQELAKMVECLKQGKGHIILPIFYFLDPRDVRHQSGPYKEAFEQHIQKHDPETVKEWREALQEVGQMKGWHVTESDGQGAVIDQVFSKVELHLRSNYTLVTDELVAIDFHVHEVTKLLNLDSGDGKVLGIHGIGGVGKTTIAKAVYDSISTKFNRCCFLENIREVLSKNDGIMALQNKVISSILRDDVQVKDASQGLNIIRDRVCKYKALIILDDVDERFEFGQILGKLGYFSSETRFIITTRDKRVLEFCQEYKLYEPKEMTHHDSLQLFSIHAFGMHCPQEEYATLSEEYVKVAGGLPLALKVIGSLMFHRDRQFWEEKLLELKEIPPTSNEVQQRLKISYNELTHNEKQIFLDIACFFIGENKDLPFLMWGGCKFYPESGFRTLVLRSLIKVDERNQFWMHDLLRDLGRAIVIEEDVKHPWKRSRVWSNEDALNMLKNGKGTDRVEMLRVDMTNASYLELTDKEFKKLSGLKYLDMKDGKLLGDFSEILPYMCWIKLNHCSSIPVDINMQKVVILDLQDCRMTDDWKGWNGIKAAQSKLKVINLHGCSKLNRVPELSQCGSLEWIDLTYCFEMMGELQISNFKNLKVVRFQGTKVTELTGGMGKLQKLQQIKAGKLVWKEEVPLLPTSIKHLTISSPRVPNLLELKDLEELCFEECDAAPKIPGGIWQLPKLKTLKLFKCSGNGSLLVDQDGALPSSLTHLTVQWCFGLKELPNLANLNNLKELRLVHIGVREIHGLGELRVLEVLEISGSSALDNLDSLKNLVQLKELTLESCGLDALPCISNLIQLHKLVIIKCPYITKIPGLGELKQSLLHLEVSGCSGLANIEGLESLEVLESLTLESVKLPPLHVFDKLWVITQVEDTDIPPLCRQYHSPLKQFPDLSGLLNLKQLYIMGWKQLPDMTGLERLCSLQSLVMAACKSLTRLPDLSGLKKLETLDVTGCVRLVDVTGLSSLESLQFLNMSCCWSVEELPDLSGLKNLESLDVTECTELTKLVGLEKLESLKNLYMNDCKSLKELPDMSGLKNLEVINLSGCTQLKRVEGLEKLERLWLVRMEKWLEVKHYLKLAAFGVKQLTRSVRGALRNRS